MRRRKNVSNRSVLLTYQLRRRDDVSAWSETFKLVTKMGQFLLGTKVVRLLAKAFLLTSSIYSKVDFQAVL